MNENRLCKVRRDIQDVLDNLEIEAVNDPEDKTMFFADVELAAIDDMIMNVCLCVSIKEKNQVVTMEMKMEDEIDEDKILPVMELVNLINRQAIVGYLFVYLRDRTVFFKKDIYLVNGRLNKSELERSINHLLVNVAFYSVDIGEIADFKGTLDEISKRHWIGSSYLHKGCSLDEPGKTITMGIALE